MYLQELIEVAIGLIFAWLVLSIATMQVQEWIASYLGWRSKELEKAIRNMLGDKAWAEQLYQHPLVKSLSEKTGGKSSYIPADKFAVALFDIVMSAGTDASLIQRELLTIQSQTPRTFKEALRLIPPRWWDQIKTFVVPYINYFFDKSLTTLSLRYKNFIALVSEAHTSPEKLQALLLALVEKPRQTGNYSALEIGKIYPDFPKAVLNIYNQLRAKDSGKWPELNEAQLKEILDQLALVAKLELKEFSRLFSFYLTDDRTLDRLSASLDAIAQNNPHLQKALYALKPDLKDFISDIQKKEKGLFDKLVKSEGQAIEVIKEQEKHLLEARQAAETWFDDVMQRLSGWYKRKAQLLALLIGLIFAAIFNVDSISLSYTLWNEPTLRQAYVSYVQDFVEKNKDKADQLDQIDLNTIQTDIKGINLPLGWATQEYTGTANCKILAAQNEVVGFYFPPFAKQENRHCIEITNPPRNGQEVLLKFLGILISALAAMQGAPFWFDILKKLINIRGTGANPAENSKEGTQEKAAAA